MPDNYISYSQIQKKEAEQPENKTDSLSPDQENKVQLPKSGHTVKRQKIGDKNYFIKDNKNGNAKASLYECIFSQVAKLFMGDCTPNMLIIKDDQNKNQSGTNIMGVVSQSIEDILPEGTVGIQNPEAIEGATVILPDTRTKSPDFSEIKPCFKKNFEKQKKHFFLSEMNDHFPSLMQKAIQGNNQNFSVNLKSLANVLTTSYFLEEDDLHKENIGFYLKENNGKHEIVFFKIDHDLMFLDSIMSHAKDTARPEKRGFSKDFFKMTRKDLDNFPDIQKSAPHFWVTKKRHLKSLLPNTSKKAYTTKEIKFFKTLKHDEAFQKEKWTHLLKCAYMPFDHIQETITNSIPATGNQTDNQTKTEEFAKVKTSRAVLARQDLLKIRLLSSNQFKAFWDKQSGKEKLSLIENITGKKDQNIIDEMNDILKIENPTPFYIALKLGKIKCHEDSKKYHHHLPNTIQNSTHTLEENFDVNTPVEAYFEKFYLNQIWEKTFHLDSFKDNFNLTDHHDNFLYAVIIYYGQDHKAYEAVKEILNQNTEKKENFIQKITNNQYEKIDTLEAFSKAIEIIANNPQLNIRECHTLITTLFDCADLTTEQMKKILDDCDNKEVKNSGYKLIHTVNDSNYLMRNLFSSNRRSQAKYFKTDARQAMERIYQKKIAEEKKDNSIKDPSCFAFIKSIKLCVKEKFKKHSGPEFFAKKEKIIPHDFQTKNNSTTFKDQNGYLNQVMRHPNENSVELWPLNTETAKMAILQLLPMHLSSSSEPKKIEITITFPPGYQGETEAKKLLTVTAKELGYVLTITEHHNENELSPKAT